MRKLISAILLFLGATLSPGCNAAAAGPGSSLVLGPCDRRAQDSPTHTMCLAKELDRLGPVVERYVQETRRGLRAKASKALEEGSIHEAEGYTEAAEQFEIAQALWVAFREAHCTMRAKQITGSGAALAPYRCKVQLTYSRLQEMQGEFISSPDPAIVAQPGIAADSLPP